MKIAIAAAALLTVMGTATPALPAPLADATAPQADADAPCNRLIDQARHLPDSAWAKGVKALEPSLTINRVKFSNNQSPFEAALAGLPEVKKGLGDELGLLSVFVDRLPGTDIYVASEYGGTLQCQDSVFLSAPHGSVAKIVDPPLGWEGGLCWTQSADTGLVFGQPAFVEHGAVSQTTEDESIKITPWGGAEWGPACRFALHFRPVFKRTKTYRGDRIVADAADKIAVAVAAAYNRALNIDRQTGMFWYGKKPSDNSIAEIKRLINLPNLALPGSFPTFGAKDALQYSYSGFALFPLTLKGRAYIAAIGHDGVGWREGSDTLLEIYAHDGDTLTPLAGFVISRSIGGLSSAVLEKATDCPGHIVKTTLCD